MSAYVGRFAPSPTGLLHAGSLVAALASWLDARAHGGRWLVRIEDVDTPRCVAGADQDILKQLALCGLHPDDPVLWQSQRDAVYQHALDQLIAQGLAYPCGCSRKDIESAQTSPTQRHHAQVYPGTCRQGLQGKPARAWRLNVQAVLELHGMAPLVHWHDRRLGEQTQDVPQEVGDFVLRRADGLWAYQLAVVVDDAAQGVTTVVRGADLLASTPRQIFLQRLLGLPAPAYLHVPVAIDAAGLKLSKQTHAAALPDDPLPSLAAAWSFLQQPAPPAAPRSAAEFWAHAARAWSRLRLPPVAMLPAPPGA